MDGDDVESEPSDTADDGKPATYTGLFLKIFPSYLAMGMSWEEFWHGPSFLPQAYRKAQETKLRQEEWSRWRQGAYVYHALLDAAPVMRASFSKQKVEPGKYPEEPWPITEKEAQMREEQRLKEEYRRELARLKEVSKRNTEQEGAKKDAGDRQP